MLRKSLAIVLHFRAIDQFLSLQHAAEQEADNHQNDGDFDQGEAHLFLSHGILLSKDATPTLSNMGASTNMLAVFTSNGEYFTESCRPFDNTVAMPSKIGHERHTGSAFAR
jgi:hypothetical protein